MSNSQSLKVCVIQCVFFLLLDKASRLSISNDIGILSSDTICQLNQIFSNSEAAMLSICHKSCIGEVNEESVSAIWTAEI